MINLRLILLAILLFFSGISFSQDLIINYDEPEDLIVCDTNDFSFTITNASPDTLFNVMVTANTPLGIEYVVGSITNGVEANISVANAPVFSYPIILPFESISFTIGTRLKCELVNSINNGLLFTNTISATWDGGNNAITTDPYLIETPLLVITELTNTLTSGSQGDTITRTITIQNTRLGTLTSFIFSDDHSGGITISSSLGTVINSSTSLFEVEFGPSDFMTLGDGDGIFEQDEVIVITEVVVITDCGIDIPFTNSNYSFTWGCFSEICQQTDRLALIDIIPSEDNPELDFRAYSILPVDHCGQLAAEQGVVITNIGTHEALNVMTTINLAFAQPAGQAQAVLDANSFMRDSSGVLIPVFPSTSDPSFITDCTFPSNTFSEASFFWPSILPGDSIILSWDYFYCRLPDECETPQPPLAFEYQYLSNCPSETEIGISGASAANILANRKLILNDSVFYFIGESYLNSDEYNLNYRLKSEKLQETGVLQIEISLPCEFFWGNNDLELNGQLPFDTQINAVGNGTVITAQYNLPFDSIEIFTNFDVGFNCDLSCDPELGICEEAYLDINGDFDCGTFSTVSIESTIQEDPNVSMECSMKACADIPLMVDCEQGMPDPDFIFTHEFKRFNYDLPDNDNDRFPDGPGSVDPSLVRSDRAIPGDTVINTIRGTFLNGTDVDLMTVQFEAHSIDHNLDGGERLNFAKNFNLMKEGGIVPLTASVRIVDASTGDIFECEIGDPFEIRDTISHLFSVVNTEPTVILDRMLFEQFKYNTSFANLPCVPAGFQYETGDSLIFRTTHEMIYNPVTQVDDAELDSLPPILNLRSAVVPIQCNDFNPYLSLEETSHSHFQYSGYAYQIHLEDYATEPCIPYTGTNGTLIRFVLGKDNFFPFEYRPLAAVSTWRNYFPLGVTLVNAELDFLRYQDGANIVTNQNMPFMINGLATEIHLLPFHVPVLDEGWEMSFMFDFENLCSIEAFSPMSSEMELGLNPCLPEPINVTYSRDAANFKTGAAIVNAAVTTSCYEGFDDKVSYDIVILNSGVDVTMDAQNVWFHPVSQTGLVTNFELVNTNTGEIISSINGIFQLGILNIDQLENYQLTGINQSCETEIIELNYGWNCTPYTSATQESCSDKVLFLKAISPVGELEMDVVSPVGPFDLCEVIDYHTVEIFNAQLGNVFDVVMEMTLPLGLQIVPGSSQMAYPTGSAFVDIGEPNNIAGNVFEWDIPAINSTIQNDGLLGVSQDPNNSISIRFQTTTDCGFVAGSQIVFTVIGQQNCNRPTNNLAKTGDPLEITGINPGYETDINVSISNAIPITCGVDVPLNVNILPNGPTTSGDTVLITLPVGVSFITGSYVPINNAPTNPPIVFNNAGQEILKLKLEQGVSANTLISFEIEVTGFGLNGCADQLIQVQTVQQQDATCSTTGELCYVLAETGSTTVSIASEFPDLYINGFEIVEFNGQNYFSVSVGNNGIENETNIFIDFYLDEDGDGMLSPGDIKIDSLIWGFSLATGEIVTETFLTNISSDQFCNIMMVINEDPNCICGTQTMLLSGPLEAFQTQIVCSDRISEIGIPNLNGHTYEWQPSPYITSVDESITEFEFTNSTTDTVFFDLILSDINENGCEVTNTIRVGVLPALEINLQDINVCAGETVVLSATPGAIYNWDGPQITNPNLQTQVVTLFESATYTVIISNSIGCENMDDITVNVSPFLESFSNQTKCPEQSVSIFGELVDAPGMYCDTMSNVTGCDSIICIELTNFLSDSEEIIPLCPGDSVEVEGIFYKEPQIVCNDFISSFGCDSTHCITIEAQDEPFAEFVGVDINGELTFEQDVETQLEVTEGFPSYDWFPSEGLSCSDCFNPLATLSETTEFQVTVTDENGCSTIISLIVNVLPPCNPERLLIPNAFTPDGDGVNDWFGVEFEGFEMVANVKIFDRWGEKVYEGSGETAFWDGTIDGKPGTADVYVYIIKLTCSEGEGTRVGDVTLIR